MTGGVLIIGGTGTLGQATTLKLLEDYPETKITIFSRCELKQKQMSDSLPKGHKVKFVLGDIRDKDAVDEAVRGKEVVFHFAALKHIEVIEDNPVESVKTNILGTINVAQACIKYRVPKMLFSSTDKAVDPINVYGNCKAISEKILLHYNEQSPLHTMFYVFRWGNVVGSRGSAILSFAKTLLEEKKIYITDTRMTRFWIRIEDAVDFMLKAQMSKNTLNKVHLPPIKAASLVTVISVVAKIMGVSKYDVIFTGLRKGEKLHEDLMSRHSPGHFCSDTSARLSEDELTEMLTPILEAAYPTRVTTKRKLHILRPSVEAQA